MNKRKFVMIQATDIEKKQFKKAAKIDGFTNLAPWVRWMMHQAIKNQALATK